MSKRNYLLIFILVMMSWNTLMAQSHITLNTNSTGTHTVTGSITLAPGFEVSSGNTFHAYITLSAAISVPLATAPSNRNYIIDYTVRDSGITNPADSSKYTTQVNPVITYIDGLGRPEQIVNVKGSPGARDIVQPIVYDSLGRERLKYLPYSASYASSVGTFRSSALTDQASFYNSPSSWDASGVVSTSYPLVQTIFEPSPLGRMLEQGAPGANWQVSANHTVEQGYSSNSSGDTVKLWTISGTTCSTSSSYAEGQLTKMTVTDESGNQTIEFEDKDGRIVLKRAEAPGSAFISTYYVYDDAGNLRYVIPPAVSSTFTEGSPAFQQYIYAYKYDDRRRLTDKKIPGKGWEEMVYNKHDQLVMSRDTIQRNNGKWLFTKYDALGRVAITGIITNSTSRGSWQSALDAQSSTTIVSRDNANSSTTGTGYTDTAYPSHSDVQYYHSINYYDDYDFFGGSTYPFTGSKMTKGLLTGTKMNVLGSSDMLLTSTYYDNKGRAMKIYSQHYKGGSGSLNANNHDEITNVYNDFTGELKSSTRAHKVGGSTMLTTVTEYEYDHTGRKRNSWMTINGSTRTMLSQIDYNELGQVSAKKFHSTDEANFKQAQAYTYNERGWLKTSSAPLFAMQLKYDDGTVPEFNGNIADQLWGTPGSLTKNYAYKYDELNRLTRGTSSEGLHEQSIVYNSMGNITGLRRYALTPSSTLVDQLYYDYSGNRLTAVTDTNTTSTSAAFQLPYTTAYSYDYNGNMTIRNNTNGSYEANDISDISYNHLNLPKVVTAASTVTYTYDVSGRKLRKAITGGDTREYINGIEYNNGSLDFVQTEEGIARASGSYGYEYSLKDHLGNNRVNFDIYSNAARKIQEEDYYPFGLEIGRYVSGTKNPYLYNGKELQEETKQYDYGARFYDPVVGRFTTIDALSEEMRSHSPYNYGLNNPLRFTDPDGNAPTDIIIRGLQNSSITVKTDLIDIEVNASSLGVNFSGNHTLEGNDILQAGLDIAGIVDPTGVADGLNASLSASKGDWLSAGISGLGVIPYVGDLAKVGKIGKDIKIISNAIEAVNGNSKASTKAQHVYEIYKAGKNGAEEVVKTGVSGGKVTKAGESYRATSQANKWNKAEGAGTYKTRIKESIPAGKGARQKALDAEGANAERLRKNGQLRDPEKHQRP